MEGEPDEVLYDTLYRYFVFFGMPERLGKMGAAGKIVQSFLERKGKKDNKVFKNDCRRFSL